MERIGVLLLVYNSFEDTAKLVRQLAEERFRQIALSFIIVDNASPNQQGKDALLAELSQSDVLLTQSANLGYAQGNNVGLRWAKEQGLHWVFLLNPDIRIQEPELLEQVFVAAQQLGQPLMSAPLVSGVAPYILRPQLRHWLLPFLYKMDNMRRLREAAPHQPIRVYRLYGCFLLIDVEQFAALGWFDPATFLFSEEDIVGEKARLAGKPIWLLPHLQVGHEGSASINAALRLRKYRIMAQSHYYYLHQYRGYPAWAATLLACNVGLYNLLMGIKNAWFGRDLIENPS